MSVRVGGSREDDVCVVANYTLGDEFGSKCVSIIPSIIRNQNMNTTGTKKILKV